jgi:AcrR family transcriptional regulator
MIIGAVIPLILERGRDVTSKEIAEAAGIAEGTIFRAFGDKETLIAAAVERYLDPLTLIASLRSMDRDLPLDDKLQVILGLMRDRFSGVIRMVTATGGQVPPDRRPSGAFAAVIGELLEPHRRQLAVEPAQVAGYLRIIAFATAIPAFGESIELSTAELATLIQHGIVTPTTPISTGKEN